MKVVRVVVDSTPMWGVIDGSDIELLHGAPFREIVRSGRWVPLAEANLLAPVMPGKIMCLGRNFRAHVDEMGYSTPSQPSIFIKPLETVIGPDEAVVLPPEWLSSHVEHEAELAVVIGRGGRFIQEEEALDAIFGFSCADDVSARDLQKSDPQPTRGKGFDTFCPVGPWIETDFDSEDQKWIRCSVNGVLRQDGSTSDMISKVPFLISHISQFTTLAPGDLILTGSPGGTGRIVDGDIVEVDIEGIGVLRHRVVGADHCDPK